MQGREGIQSQAGPLFYSETKGNAMPDIFSKETKPSPLFDGKKPGNKLGGPSGIPGYDAVIGPRGAEIGVVPTGTDPDQAGAILTRTEAKREIARTEGMQHIEDKHLDAVVQESIKEKPVPTPVHPGAFDYLGV